MRYRKSPSAKPKKAPEPPKPKKDKQFLQLVGTVEELLPSATFRVRLDNGHEILSYLSGRMRVHRIRILPGDRVTLEISPYDLTKGRIIFRH